MQAIHLSYLFLNMCSKFIERHVTDIILNEWYGKEPQVQVCVSKCSVLLTALFCMNLQFSSQNNIVSTLFWANY